MKKKVVYFVDERGKCPPWEYIKALSSVERNKCFEYIAYLEAMGESVRRPVGDYLGNKLYELRPKQSRVIYFFMLRDYAVILHAFRKKANALPAREMRVALSRMDDFIARYKARKITLGDK